MIKMWLNIGFLLLLGSELWAQSPHGTNFAISCSECHSTAGWEVDPAVMTFRHDSTDFALEGQHIGVSCIDCHQTLVFAEAEAACISCHTDLHRNTLGADCARCHSSQHWLIDNIQDLHLNSGFQLLGTHREASCVACHSGAAELMFPPIGNECISCHREDFTASRAPDHVQTGLSVSCTDCHDVASSDWSAAYFTHDIYPLEKAHLTVDCASCHTSPDYSSTPTDCFACHEQQYREAVKVDHQSLNLSVSCTDCHDTSPGWAPADFEVHDDFFPIYSGGHDGTWAACVDCHGNGGGFQSFTCINCHTNPVTDEVHGGVNGYFYADPACIACHPTGEADVIFDHNSTNFPLTGAHQETSCVLCHGNGFEGTPTDCVACHQADFLSAVDPDHQRLNFSTDCVGCHTTDPGWSPATFENHDEVYPLQGAHQRIENQCASCHSEGFSGTPTTCVGCHQEAFDGAKEPDHVTLQIHTQCADCHGEESWVPSTFEHDAFYELRGAHQMIENQCAACHTPGFKDTPTTCVGCHQENYLATEDPDHQRLGFSQDCATCHTETDWSPATVNHDEFYELRGAHKTIENECYKCHSDGFSDTPNTCFACHSSDYTTAENPNHLLLRFSVNCASCHSEESWKPGFFEHDQYYALRGAHAAIANNCALCHGTGIENTPSTCVGCHRKDFNESVSPPHLKLRLGTDCQSCHSVEGWSPSSFDHDAVFELKGAHQLIENKCVSCHGQGVSNTPTTCVGCHTQDVAMVSDPNHESLGFSSNCTDCHSQTAWSPVTFDHDLVFELQGAHRLAAADCRKCHSEGYSNTPTTCVGCHTGDFQEAKEPDHVLFGFSSNCVDCHGQSSWSPSSFDHDQYYVLRGAHKEVENQCASCHSNGVSNTPTTCFGCHSEDYNAAQSPVHESPAFSTSCTDCHGEEAWSPAAFDHDQFYVLEGAHKQIENQCSSCHSEGYANTPTTCVGCHTVDFNEAAEPDHVLFGFSTTCVECHGQESWSPSSFEHDQYYVLRGAHKQVENQCASCHSNGVSNTPTTCFGCHSGDYNAAQSPVHESPAFSTSCTDCHGEEAWSPAAFDHDQFYVLEGAHKQIENQCSSCHSEGYANTPTTCVGCHTGDFNEAKEPDHVLFGFSSNCVDCHSQESWSPSSFEHDQYYVLRGAHKEIEHQCASCHSDGVSNTPTTCFGCHSGDYNAAQSPVHESPAFSTSCTDCHSEEAWSPAVFDHDQFYVLQGAHKQIENQCSSCHAAGYSNSPTTCVGCHTGDFNEAKEPDHVLFGFSSNCVDCHSQESWSPSSFEHDQYYVLRGAHKEIEHQCASCHSNGVSNTPTTCFGCHSGDYNAAQSPVHESSAFSTSCTDCHGEEAWSPAVFDHDQFYVLQGAHKQIENQCSSCHAAGYSNTPTTCVGCHTGDFNEAKEPDHVLFGFSSNCVDCHSQESWSPSSFEHDQYYVLRGAHKEVENQCASCHSNGVSNTPTTCFGCHSGDYNAAQSPVHESPAFSTSCTDCHGEEAWSPAVFDHDQFYVLQGAHKQIENQCSSCHAAGYSNTPTTCVGCHTGDFNEAKEPDHVLFGFSSNCVDCHSQESWSPSSFEHDQYYVLRGAHKEVENQCASCHSNGVSNTPTTCFGCHSGDYDAAKDPDHRGLSFSTNCTDCHGETAWSPAAFDHDQFYVLQGAHKTIENQCSSCHAAGYSNTPTTCVGCHTGDFNEAKEPDHVLFGFSSNCVDCHGQSSWSPSSFEHDQYYVLRGAHKEVENQCASCHSNGVSNTPTTCFGCHSGDYDAAKDPDHRGLSFPTNCTDCHGETAWIPASFDHDQFYVLQGAHKTIENQCSSCHSNGYSNTPTTCFGCHSSDYNSARDPNHAAAGFSTNCTECHNQRAWEPADFDHDRQYFPIYSGNHRGEWSKCTDCHTNPNNFAQFSCIDCHEHNDPTDLAKEHDDVSGYVFQSTACYACHPRGDD